MVSDTTQRVSRVSLSVDDAKGGNVLIDTMMDRQMGLLTHMDPESLILLHSPPPARALVQPLLSSLGGVESQEVLAGQQSSSYPRNQLVVAL